MKVSFWRRWLKRLDESCIVADLRSRRRCRRPVLLALEVLEDRTAPAVFTVTSLGDAGTGSGASGDLAYCIAQSNLNESTNTIQFALPAGPQTITLSSQLVINGPLTINAGAAPITISGGNTTRVFLVAPSASAILDNLTIANGNASFGGGIYNAGTLSLSGCTLVDNWAYGSNGGSPDQSSGGGGGGGAGLGGAIYNAGTLDVTNSTLVNNQATGGNGGSIDGNYPNVNAGAGAGPSGGAAGAGSTSSNGSNGGAGGLGSGGGGGGGTYGAFNSPTAGNGGNGGFGGGGGGGGGSPFGGGGSAGGLGGPFGGNGSGSYSSWAGGGGGGAALGGAIFNQGTLTLYFCTITNNSATGGNGGGSYSGGTTGMGLAGGLFNNAGGSVVATDSIIAGNNSSSGNADTFGSFSGSSNLISVFAELGPLQDNGGPTFTMAPGPDSAAIGAGTAVTSITVDQRGAPRLGWTNIGAFQDSFQVITTADSGPGSLRQAILNANASGGLDPTITFDILEDGYNPVIQPLSPLPSIIAPVTIDGLSQPGTGPGDLQVEINGAYAGSGPALILTAGGSTIEGLIIDGFNGAGVVIIGPSAVGNVLECNIIGAAYDGYANLGDGVLITNGAADNIIGGPSEYEEASYGNIISGNGGAGVEIGGTNAAGSGNGVIGNLIGTDESGEIAMGNGGPGVLVDAGTLGAVIGGAGAGYGNVISGNGGAGISLVDASSVIVLGNLIGVAEDGVTLLGNGGGGITLLDSKGASKDNCIGMPGFGNVIAGNNGYGVTLDGSLVYGNMVSGNFIGTNSSFLQQALANSSGGVLIEGGAFDNVIGMDNVIAFNPLGVVEQDATTMGNTITGNIIETSFGPGIELNGVTPTALPVLTGVTGNGDGSVVSGYVQGTPGDSYEIELFASPVPGRAYQGVNFIGTVLATANSSGLATFSQTIPTLPAFLAVTATATDTLTGETSQFSNGPPALVMIGSGSGQQAFTAQPLANPLTVTVYDAYGNLLPGIMVTFAGPAGSVVFAGSGITNATGQAMVSATAGLVAGTYQVIASAAGLTSAPFTLTNVAGAAPVVSVGTSALSNVGDTFTETGSFVDGAGESCSALVNYGDGSATQPLALNADGTFVLSHAYSTEGTYYVVVTVTDVSGLTGSATGRVDVFLDGIDLDLVRQSSAPPGGSVTVSSVGISAMLTRSASDTGIGLLLVTPAPTFVALNLAMVPAPSGEKDVTQAYDIRSINLSSGDAGFITFSYASNALNNPDLLFYSAAAGGYIPVVPSQAQLDSLTVDPATHTIRVLLDDTSTPELDALKGTVFTVTVTVPTTNEDTSASLVYTAAASLSGTATGGAEGTTALASALSTALLGVSDTGAPGSGGGDALPSDDSTGGFGPRLLRFLPIVIGSLPGSGDDRPTLILSPSQATLPDPGEAPLPDAPAKPMSLLAPPAGPLAPRDQVFVGDGGLGLDFFDTNDTAPDVDLADPAVPTTR